MNKPFTLKIQELEKEVVDVINRSEIPVFCWKIILENIFKQLEIADQNEIVKYRKEQEEVKKNDKN